MRSAIFPADVFTKRLYGMAAETENAVTLKRMDDGIIKALRNRIVLVNKDCYHNKCNFDSAENQE